jgi:hypothetical protein
MEHLMQNARHQLEELDFRKREDEAASKGFLGGLALGILVGAVLALIFAPRTGSETRDTLAGTATDLKHKATDLVHQVTSADAAAASTPGLGDEPAIEREIGEPDVPATSGVI